MDVGALIFIVAAVFILCFYAWVSHVSNTPKKPKLKRKSTKELAREAMENAEVFETMSLSEVETVLDQGWSLDDVYEIAETRTAIRKHNRMNVGLNTPSTSHGVLSDTLYEPTVSNSSYRPSNNSSDDSSTSSFSDNSSSTTSSSSGGGDCF